LSVIDYGCGSGILAIAALKLGAHSAIGIDIDPQALIASRDNAQRNSVSEGLTVSLSDADLRAADLVMANILAGPLQSLAPRLAELTRPNGQIVLSGVLAEQAALLETVYGAWFDMESTVFQEGWARLSGRRR
jgi:ribosomal protein L11 methyltransferase